MSDTASLKMLTIIAVHREQFLWWRAMWHILYRRHICDPELWDMFWDEVTPFVCDKLGCTISDFTNAKNEHRITLVRWFREDESQD